MCLIGRRLYMWCSVCVSECISSGWICVTFPIYFLDSVYGTWRSLWYKPWTLILLLYWPRADVETGDVVLRVISSDVQLKTGSFLEVSSSAVEQMEGWGGKCRDTLAPALFPFTLLKKKTLAELDLLWGWVSAITYGQRCWSPILRQDFSVEQLRFEAKAIMQFK